MSTVGEMIADHHLLDAIAVAAKDRHRFLSTPIGAAIREFQSAAVFVGQMITMEGVPPSVRDEAWDRVEECERMLRSVIDQALREARDGT